MPAKQKYNKEDVVAAALRLVRRSGLSAVTARGLGVELGVSSRPIFSIFENMQEVLEATTAAAKAVYNEYIDYALKQPMPFKSVGMQYIKFAANEPKLFELLFMKSDKNACLSEILPSIDENSGAIEKSITDNYPVNPVEAKRLYENMWVFSHGLACLCASGVITLTEEEASERLTRVCIGLIKNKG
jgi:AcrR family transcriptional regulator